MSQNKYRNLFIAFTLFFAVHSFSAPDPLPYQPIALPLPDTLDQLYRDSATIQIGRVRVNQAGYRPGDSKWIYYIGNASQFSVISGGKVVGTGSLAPTRQSTSSSIKIKASNNATRVANGDTRYTMASETVSGAVQEGKLPDLPNGVYRVVVGSDTSQPFVIDPRVYSMVKDALLKFYGIQRSGDSESWFHPPSHLKDGLKGGWYDCGDHLKEGITQSYAMMVLGLSSAAFSDRDTDKYARNHNSTILTDGIPDILYETKHGADYVLASYDQAKGNIADMITSVGDFKDHMWWGSPEYQDNMQPDRGGPPRPLRKENSSTQFGRWAAGLAFLSKQYAPYDKAYAEKALKVAREIYAHGGAIYRTQNSPAYSGDNTIYDDLAIAAVALAWATGEKKFIDDALRNETIGSWPQSTFDSQPKGSFKSGWFAKENGSLLHAGNNTSFGNVQMFGLWALYKFILRDPTMSTSLGITESERMLFIEDVIYSMIRNIADVGMGDANIDLPDPTVGTGQVKYHRLWKHMLTDQEWVWNRYQAGNITELYIYYDVAREIQGTELPNTPASTNWMAQEVLELVVRQMDFMLGVNPWDVSMVFGIGDKNFNHPHHRASNPEGKNVPGGFYRYRPPVGALQGSYTPNDKNVYDENWSDYFHSEVCLDGTTALFLPTVGLAQQEDLAGAPDVTVEIEYVGYDKAYITVRQSKYGISVLSYGTAANKASLVQKLNSKHGIIHRFELKGLSPGTAYFFDVEASNTASGKTTLDNNNGKFYTFTTAINPNGPAQIENITVCNITHTSAQILWYTPNGEYQSKVKWSEQPLPYAQMPNSKEGDDGGIPTKFHMVTIEGLKEQTTYYYGVESDGKIITQDNKGKPLQFTTPVEHVKFDIRTLAYEFGGLPFLGIIMVNQDPKTYDNLEFRIYLTGTEEEMSLTQAMATQPPPVNQWELMARLDIGIKYRPDGHQDSKHFKAIVEQQLKTAGLVRIEDSYNPETGEWDWYFPINIGAAAMESGARFRLDIAWTPRTPWHPYLDYGAPGPLKHVPSMKNGDWSFRSHSRQKGEPADYSGITYGVKENLDNNFWNLEINRYIAVYRKGEFIWGYSPSAREQATKRAHYEIDMTLDAPFDLPSGAHISIASPNDSILVTGKAKITENGYVTDIWANGQRVPVTPQTARYDVNSDLWLLNIPVGMESGGNNVDITVFAGPDPQCEACKGNAGCAFENRSFFLEYAISGRYKSALSLKENGVEIPAPFLAAPGKTSFVIELTDSIAAEKTTLPVRIFNSDKTFEKTLDLKRAGVLLFKSGLISVTAETAGDEGPDKFSLAEGDTIWVEYRDAIDHKDMARKFVQLPATYPVPVVGYIQDTDSSGLVNSVAIIFNKFLKALPDSVQIGSSLMVKPAGGHIFNMNDRILSIQLAKAIEPPQAPAGKVYLKFKGKDRQSSFLLAPYLVGAEIVYNTNRQLTDTLNLTFSTPVKNDASMAFSHRAFDGRISNLSISSILGFDGNTLRLLIPTDSAISPKIGYKIHIAAGITDTTGLAAGPFNPWCNITGTPLMPPAKLQDGYFLDENRDGILDRVVLSFDTLVQASGITLIVKWIDAGLTTTLVSPEVLDSTHLTFNLETLSQGGPLPLQTWAQITVQDNFGIITLADSADPILLSAEIIHHKYPRYITEKDWIRKQTDPNFQVKVQVNYDTLAILLSETIKNKSALTGVDNTPIFIYGDIPGLSLYPTGGNVRFLNQIPMVDGNRILFPLIYTDSSVPPKVGDYLDFYKNTAYTDDAGNTPATSEVRISGEVLVFNKFKTTLFVPLLSVQTTVDQYEIPKIAGTPVLNDYGNLVATDPPDSSFDWILPQYMERNGEVKYPDPGKTCPTPKRPPEAKDFPQNCLSAVYVISDGPYRAAIDIYDHFGKHVHSSKQGFGYCGELKNNVHKHSGGYKSFLVWNQKDNQGGFVGSGVYIWKVKYFFGQKQRMVLYKQGIARGSEPPYGCSIQ